MFEGTLIGDILGQKSTTLPGMLGMLSQNAQQPNTLGQQQQVPQPQPQQKKGFLDNPALQTALSRLGGTLAMAGERGMGTAAGLGMGLNSFLQAGQENEQRQWERERQTMSDALSLATLKQKYMADAAAAAKDQEEKAQKEEAIRALSNPNSTQEQKTAAGLILNPAAAGYASGIKVQQPGAVVNVSQEGLGDAFKGVFTEQAAKETAKSNDDYLMGVQGLATEAKRTLPRLERTLDDFASGNLKTGWGQDIAKSMTDALAGIGVVEPNASLPKERLQQITADQVRANIKALGSGTAISDSDLKFTLNGVINLTKSGAYNKEQLNDLYGELQTAIERARIAYKGQTAIEKGEFQGSLQNYVNSGLLDFRPQGYTAKQPMPPAQRPAITPEQARQELLRRRGAQ